LNKQMRKYVVVKFVGKDLTDMSKKLSFSAIHTDIATFRLFLERRQQ